MAFKLTFWSIYQALTGADLEGGTRRMSNLSKYQIYHQIVLFKLKMHKTRFWPGLCPGPYWGGFRRSPRPPIVGWGRAGFSIAGVWASKRPKISAHDAQILRRGRHDVQIKRPLIGSRALSFSDPYFHFACLSVRHSVILSFCRSVCPQLRS